VPTAAQSALLRGPEKQKLVLANEVESPKAVNASEEFLGQRDDDARRASNVAESVFVLVWPTSPTS
jgi:hypothetical protein